MATVSVWMLVLLVAAASFVSAGPHRGRTSSSEEEPLTHVKHNSGQPTCGYDSCPATKNGVLNVHLIAHTHDDVGWLKTVDQYYFGSRSMTQKAGVQYILDSVIDELMKDPGRRFVYVETFFFWKWWGEQSDLRRHHVKRLVAEGRLEFAGGAWSMHDEAVTHYQSSLDSLTWGLRKLNDTFGECGRPRVAWQIDPFGHSRESANMFAQAGYDALLLGRSDYQDRSRRAASAQLEMLWRGSDDLGKSSDLLTGIMFNTYSPPPGFCFDILCSDDPIIDDPKSPDNNVDAMVEKFLNYVNKQAKAYNTRNVIVTMGEDFNYQDARMWFKNLDKLINTAFCVARAGVFFVPLLPSILELFLQVKSFLSYISNEVKAYRTNHITVTMGGDFTYMDAQVWYKNMDKLIKYVNAREPLVNLLYSTPGCYVKSLHDAKATWPAKQDDFFPYASDEHSYWTGFYTSRPSIKLFERRANNFLQVCKQLYAMTNLNEKDKVDLNMLRSAMGIMQHHDAVTGTEKQHVANDYARILEEGIQDCLITTRESLNKLMNEKTQQGRGKNNSESESEVPFMPLSMCQLNMTECPDSETSKKFVVTVYNPVGHVISTYIRLPVTGKKYTVQDSTGALMSWQLTPLAPSVLQQLSMRTSNATAELVVLLPNLLPLGYRSFYVTEVDKDHAPTPSSTTEHPPVDCKAGEGSTCGVEAHDMMMGDARLPVLVDSQPRALQGLSGAQDQQALDAASRLAKAAQQDNKEDYTIGNGIIEISIDPSTGYINNLFITENGNITKIPFKQELMFYQGAVGNNEEAKNRSSGAYIFRPNGSNAQSIYTRPKNTIYKGALVEELHQVFSEWASQVVRIYKGDMHAEFEWLVGPIPVDDKVGKEVVSRFSTDLRSAGSFLTDSNGRQMLMRMRDRRPTWKLDLHEPVAGNYYPVTSTIALKDNTDGRELYLLTDRAQGGSSLKDGQLELMIHRRLLHDDAFGVDEALDEKGFGNGLVARGTHYLVAGTAAKRETPLSVISRQLALVKLLQPAIFISSADNFTFETWQKARNEFSGLNRELPPNVHILTLEPWKDRTVLLRLEHFLQKVDAPETLSKQAVVNLRKLFSGIEIISVRETMLGANQFIEDSKRFEWNTSDTMVDDFNDAYLNSNDTQKREEYYKMIDKMVHIDDDVDPTVTNKIVDVKLNNSDNAAATRLKDVLSKENQQKLTYYLDDYFPSGSGVDSQTPSSAEDAGNRRSSRKRKQGSHKSRQSRLKMSSIDDDMNIILEPMQIRTFIINAKFLD